MRGLGGKPPGPRHFQRFGKGCIVPWPNKLAFKLALEVTMEIGSSKAKNRLSELLDRAERGEDIVITRRGHPIAKLVRVDHDRDRDRAREAARRIRELAREMNLGPFDWNEWKKYRDDGRR
jgi:prevent-host-death family protein